MALIKCPECGKEVSDTVKMCPSCGYKIKRKNKKKIIILTVLFFVLISISVAVGLLMYKQAEKKKTEFYRNNMSEVILMIDNGSKSVDSCGTLIYNVWNNAIQKEYDDTTDKYTLDSPRPGKDSSFKEQWEWLDEDHFYDYNTALQNLFSDEEFASKINKIYIEQNKIKEKMQELKNPPAQFEEEYGIVKNYYEIYISFATTVTDVNGNFQTWSNNYDSIKADLLNCQKKVQTYVNNKK